MADTYVVLKNNVRLNLLVLKCDKDLELRKIMHYYVWFWYEPKMQENLIMRNGEWGFCFK
jgi:hypothetical protein